LLHSVVSGQETGKVHSNNVKEFWSDMSAKKDFSLYRDYMGVRKMDGNGAVFPPDFEHLERGEYQVMSRTYVFEDQELFTVVTKGVQVLNDHRPLDSSTIEELEKELLLHYNHFSLFHEGNNLTLSETAVITGIMSNNRSDWKHSFHGEDIPEEIRHQIQKSDQDVREAINHIAVAEMLPSFAERGIDEEMILQLHAFVMNGLLINEEEGFAGEYRKCKIGILGETRLRVKCAEVPAEMKLFFQKTVVRGKEEDLFQYIARVHNEFQRIHPFRDGNGRIGRLIINLILLQHGFPFFVLPTAVGNLFNHACHLAGEGKREIFARLIAEACFYSLARYEKALDNVELLPTNEMVLNRRVADSPIPSRKVPRVVSPD
jgi:fido (protein-threonine AMPylation protein)